MSQPVVSVIVPAFNQAQYLRAGLDSLWFQDYPELEIVVVNDGATDETPEVIAAFQHDLDNLTTSYASRYDAATDTLERTHHPVYPREGRCLRLVTHAQNRGLAAALNSGVAAATGTYCTYMPCDNLAYPHMVGSLVDALLDRKAEFAYADMHIVDDAMHVLRHFKLPEYSFAACFGDWYLCGVCKLYARDLHARFGDYDEALLAHDHELFQRFAQGGARFTHVPKALMAVRDHPTPRQVDIHAPTSWNRLLSESKILVEQARAYLTRREPTAFPCRESGGNDSPRR